MVLTRDIVQELAWNNAETITGAMLQDYTEIGDFAFMDCTGLIAITIPSTITKIGKCAFKRCSSLVKDAGTRQRLITIPNSVTEIGEGAFKSCYNLERVNLQCSIDQLDDELFSCCVRLKSVTGIPSGVTRIGKECFEFCQCLTAITLPTTVTSIDDEAFANCIRLYAINGITQTDITRVGLNAFYNCIGLTSITLPGTVTEIGDFAFDGSGLTSALKVNGILAFLPRSTQGVVAPTIMSGVTTIAGGAFSKCKEITTIDIPSTVTTIGVSAFEYCSKLLAITGGTGLQTIGNHAFYGCSVYINKFKRKLKQAGVLTAYKGFDGSMKCQGEQYTINTTKTYSGDLVLCESGLHACMNPLDCYNYYFGLYGTDVKICKVDVQDRLLINGTSDDDTKIVARKITPKQLLTPAEVFAAANE